MRTGLPHRSAFNRASANRVAAQLPAPRQQNPKLPFRLAQFKCHVNRGILVSGGCVSTIELHHLDPPRLDGGWNAILPPDHPPPPWDLQITTTHRCARNSIVETRVA